MGLFHVINQAGRCECPSCPHCCLLRLNEFMFHCVILRSVAFHIFTSSFPWMSLKSLFVSAAQLNLSLCQMKGGGAVLKTLIACNPFNMSHTLLWQYTKLSKLSASPNWKSRVLMDMGSREECGGGKGHQVTAEDATV